MIIKCKQCTKKFDSNTRYIKNLLKRGLKMNIKASHIDGTGTITKGIILAFLPAPAPDSLEVCVFAPDTPNYEVPGGKVYRRMQVLCVTQMFLE